MSDLIIEGAKGIPDGLYVIKDGELFKYKAKGGTVRSYHITEWSKGHWIDGKWCSVCGMPIATDVWGTSVDESEVHYCIECGADMRGDTK